MPFVYLLMAPSPRLLNGASILVQGPPLPDLPIAQLACLALDVKLHPAVFPCILVQQWAASILASAHAGGIPQELCAELLADSFRAAAGWVLQGKRDQLVSARSSLDKIHSERRLGRCTEAVVAGAGCIYLCLVLHAWLDWATPQSQAA